MYEIAVLIHVASMISSLVLMGGALVLGFAGKKAAMHSASFGMYATLIGFISGVGLLLDAPLSLQCATLTAYLVGVSVLYYVGYGFGNADKARFIRQTS